MKRLINILVVFMIVKLSFAQNDSLSVNSEYKIFKYPNGKIASEGYLKGDKPDGFWKSYYLTGILKSEGNWKNNKLDSIWIFYDMLGDTIEKISYYGGKKNGYYYKYFRDNDIKNRLKEKELYINGKKNDKTYIYYKNGSVKKIIPYVEDKRQGIGLEYDKEGKIITITRYKNNNIVVEEKINRYNSNYRKEGIWKEFYDNGNLKEEQNYSDGKLNGFVKQYNRDGKLVNSIKYSNGEVDLDVAGFDEDIEIKEEYNENNSLIFQGSFKNKIPIGVHRYFNDKGKVVKSETYNINGILTAEGIVLINGWEDGNWIYYYEDGKKKTNGTFSNGKKTGKWTYYYANGKIQQTGSYNGDKLTGIWKWYYNSGELLKEEYYIYGQLDGECTEFSELGEKVAKGNYIEGNKEGEWIYVVGDQKYIGKYSMNAMDGVWKSYYLDEGTLSFEGKYIQGRPDGKHEYFYPDGKIKEERYYSEGVKIKSWARYNENGKLIIVVQYKDGEVYKINGVKIKFDDTEN